MQRRWMALPVGLVLAVAAWAQPYGMGPGMMGGYGARGYGPGMMWGDDERGWGMGPGMMGGRGSGYWALERLDLTSEQRSKIAEIRKEVDRKQWDLMRQMHELRWQAEDAEGAGAADEQALRKSYDAMSALHKQMFDNGLEARRRIDAVLTPQQREQLRGARR